MASFTSVFQCIVKQNSDSTWTEEFATMVRESYPELEFLVHTNTEKRRSAKIPLDNRNSRILRQSISNYLGQSNNVQDEIVALERNVSELRAYTTAVPASLPVEDEQMHEVEKSMKNIGCVACKIRSLLKTLEPRNEPLSGSEYSSATMDRANSPGARYTQYSTLALAAHAALSSYKDIIDSYYTKLVSSSHHRPSSYWVVAEEEADLSHIHLLDSDITHNVVKMKQRLSVQEREITEREKRIKEWHKLLSNTFHSKLEVDDECSSGSTPVSYDIEAGLVKVRDYDITSSNDTHKSDKQCPLSHCRLAFICTIILVLLILGGLGVVLYFFGGFNELSSLDQGGTTPAIFSSTHIVLTTTTGINYGKNYTKHPISTVSTVSTPKYTGTVSTVSTPKYTGTVSTVSTPKYTGTVSTVSTPKYTGTVSTVSTPKYTGTVSTVSTPKYTGTVSTVSTPKYTGTVSTVSTPKYTGTTAPSLTKPGSSYLTTMTTVTGLPPADTNTSVTTKSMTLSGSSTTTTIPNTSLKTQNDTVLSPTKNTETFTKSSIATASNATMSSTTEHKVNITRTTQVRPSSWLESTTTDSVQTTTALGSAGERVERVDVLNITMNTFNVSIDLSEANITIYENVSTAPTTLIHTTPVTPEHSPPSTISTTLNSTTDTNSSSKTPITTVTIRNTTIPRANNSTATTTSVTTPGTSETMSNLSIHKEDMAVTTVQSVSTGSTSSIASLPNTTTTQSNSQPSTTDFTNLSQSSAIIKSTELQTTKQSSTVSRIADESSVTVIASTVQPHADTTTQGATISIPMTSQSKPTTTESNSPTRTIATANVTTSIS